MCKVVFRRSCFLAFISAFAFGGRLFPNGAQAAPAIFALDATQSRLTLSGSVAGYTLLAQSPGSMVTAYGGSINADVTGSAIQLTGSSALVALNSGSWTPAAGGVPGNVPACYGVLANGTPYGTIYGALRNLILDATSAPLPLTGGNFDSSKVILSVVTSSNPVFDYFGSFAGNGSKPLAGDSTNTIFSGASLTTTGGVQKLTIPINATFYFNLYSSPGDSPLNFAGQIVATRVIVPPVITSIVRSNQSVVLTVQNATLQSQLQSSTNFTSWAAAGGTVASNSGAIVFTVPISGQRSFLRVQQ